MKGDWAVVRLTMGGEDGGAEAGEAAVAELAEQVADVPEVLGVCAVCGASRRMVSSLRAGPK